MNPKDILFDIIHHEHGIVFEINQIEECILILNSMYRDRAKLNFSDYTSFFAFIEKTLIEKVLLSLSKIYDQYSAKKEGVRSLRHLNELLKNTPELHKSISTFSFKLGEENEKFFKGLSVEEFNSTEKLSKLISNTNPLHNIDLKDKLTNLRNQYLAHNQQGYTINNSDSIYWNEFDELINFAKDCLNTVSSLYLNKPCYFDNKFIKMYSIEETEYCFEELKKLIK